MADTKFKQVGKLQSSLDIPIDSDLMLAIQLAIEKRDKTIDDLAGLLKSEEVLEGDHEKVDRYITAIYKMNESIKLMEDAAVAVRVYKLDQINNEKHNK